MSRPRILLQQMTAIGILILIGHALGATTLAGDPEGPGAPPPVDQGDMAEARLARQQPGRPAGGAMTPDLGSGPELFGTELTREDVQRIDAELLENILRIGDPSERSLALVEAARYKIMVRDQETALRALNEAADSARLIPEPLRRDLRLISTSKALVDLAQEELNSAVSGVSGSLTLEPEMSIEQRIAALERGLDAFDRSAELAAQVGHPGYRPEAIYFAAEQEALGGQAIGIVAFRDPGRLSDPEQAVPVLQQLANRYIERAATHARMIDNPVWRDVALTAISVAAATSDQFELGRQIARSVPGLELRFQAILSIAEAEARRGSADLATADYAEAARTLASIPVADLRGTLNDVLIESLIAAGRFPDARRCITLYADDVDRLSALGAIAESMGSRGLTDQAREWIYTEIEPTYRDSLYRRVNQGVLSTLERFGGDSYLGVEPN